MRYERLLRVAWLSILLGIGMEALLLAAAAAFGKQPAVAAALADLVQKVSWANIVCVGLAVGTAASKQQPRAMGLAGFAAAPLAFGLARALHKAVSQALSIAAPAAGIPSPWVLAGIKAIEYTLLGFLLGRFEKHAEPRLTPHILIGAVIGLLFGGFVLWLSVRQSPSPLPAAALVTRAINEMIFPIGCSAVIGASRLFGRGAKQPSRS